MAEILNIKNWYVLYTRSRCEYKVEEALNSVGITTYLPVRKTIKKWSDRNKEVTQPLFSSYIFIHATEKERIFSLENKQVVRCLCDAGKPAIVPSQQIERLKQIVNVSSQPEVIEGVVKGDSIEITSGPFKGIKGIITHIKDKKHLAVSIELINRTVILHIADNITYNVL